MKISSVLKIIILVALLSIGGTWWYMEYGKQLTPIHNDNEGIVQEKTYVDGQTLSSGIKELGLMNTAEYYFSRSETVENSKTLDLTSLGIDFKADIPLTTNRFTFSYDGEIFAGFDFSKIELTVDNEDQRINVKMPECQIITASIDPESYKLYEYNNNIFNPINPDDFALSLTDLINAEKQNAIDKGLLDKARKNGEEIIGNFIKSFIEVDYNIIFE